MAFCSGGVAASPAADDGSGALAATTNGVTILVSDKRRDVIENEASEASNFGNVDGSQSKLCHGGKVWQSENYSS